MPQKLWAATALARPSSWWRGGLAAAPLPKNTIPLLALRSSVFTKNMKTTYIKQEKKEKLLSTGTILSVLTL